METAAVLSAIAYIVLAIRESIWCWLFGVLSPALFIIVFYDAGLFWETLLQFFYIAVAIYGFFSWRGVPAGGKQKTIVVWKPSHHLAVITLTAALALAGGLWMSRVPDAALPYLDAFTSIFAVLATFMVAWKVLSNWLYWIVIDLASMWLYVQRDLYQSAALFGFYVILAIIGYLTWRRSYRSRSQAF